MAVIASGPSPQADDVSASGGENTTATQPLAALPGTGMRAASAVAAAPPAINVVNRLLDILDLLGETLAGSIPQPGHAGPRIGDIS
jgi:hypothetical protein